MSHTGRMASETAADVARGRQIAERHIKAPPARLVNALDGKRAPDKYFQALSEADNFCRDLDGLHELQTRVQELTAERDDLADRLLSLRDAHQITLAALATANAQLKRMRATR